MPSYKNYGWTRYTYPFEQSLTLENDAFLPNPKSLIRFLNNQELLAVDAHELDQIPCLVILAKTRQKFAPFYLHEVC